MTQEDIDRILQLVAYINQAHDHMKSQRQLDVALVKAHALLPAVVQSLQWRPAANVKHMWFRGDAGFECTCGIEHAMLDDGETVTCDCGITYRLRHYVEADRNMVQGGNRD